MPEALITLDDLTLGYGSHPAVHHVDGTIARGALMAIVGANGSGKSTLLKGIAGMMTPMSGRCDVRPGTRIAYLPQQSELDRSFPARVLDLVALGLWPRRGFFRRHTAEDRASLAQALRAVGLAGFERRPIDTLSGGQLQRALFARVLVQDADLILLDEPFNAVDARTVVDLVALIKRWHGEMRTVLVVAHDLELVRANFPEALLLARRPVAWGALPGALAPENLLRARQFQEAWDEHAPWCGVGDTHEHGDKAQGSSANDGTGEARAGKAA
ncbi:zinc ABC transporter ATP-binding protein AztA [Aureimonas mangrovi]|uniref:zinc ABC transporter ATP-binding protein AztA n=1 Tax=Aureimonas mangrovi TaxID=2758041 RepID=UPI00163D7FE5|nr:zinc ABC transporter ATP-binding protein AztA [Aureimonas mangrovi]